MCYLVQILIQPYGYIPCKISINQSNPCTVDISFSSFIFVYNTTSVCKWLVPWLSTKFSLQIDESFQVSVHHPCAIWERTSEWNPGEQVIFRCTPIRCPIYIPKVDKQNKMLREMIMSLPKLTNNHIKNTYLQYLSKYTSSSVLTFRIFPVKHHINLCTYRIFCVDGVGWFTYMCTACNLPIYVKIIGTSKHHLYIIIII